MLNILSPQDSLLGDFFSFKMNLQMYIWLFGLMYYFKPRKEFLVYLNQKRHSIEIFQMVYYFEPFRTIHSRKINEMLITSEKNSMFVPRYIQTNS